MLRGNYLQVWFLPLETTCFNIFFQEVEEKLARWCSGGFRLNGVQFAYVVTKLYISMYV